MGKVIVLIGATRGLGRALVSALVGARHTVVGCGRGDDRVRSLEGQFPNPHSFARVDVTDALAVEAWAKDSLAAHGPPNLLVNNAALMNTPAPLWEVPASEFAALVGVNGIGIT